MDNKKIDEMAKNTAKELTSAGINTNTEEILNLINIIYNKIALERLIECYKRFEIDKIDE